MPPKTIPDKLPGAVCAQRIRCGKPNCKCAHGELHGPYHYRFWRDENGRQHKEYVRKADLEAVKAACEATHQQQKAIVSLLAKNRALEAKIAEKMEGFKLERKGLTEALALCEEDLKKARSQAA